MISRKLVAVAALVLLVVGFTPACGVLRGAHHDVSTVTLTAHGAFKLAWETETALLCGKPTAPEFACITPDQDKAFAAKFSKAAEYDAQVLRLVAGVPENQPTPAEALDLIQKVYALVREILADLPKSPQTTALAKSLKGVK